MTTYHENILNKIEYCFDVQLDRIKKYKENINSTYEKIIEVIENNDEILIDKCYTVVHESDDIIELNVKVKVPIDDSICSVISSFIHTIDKNQIGFKRDNYSDLDKKNLEYGKKFLNTKLKEYFSKCNFEYKNSIVCIEENINILEINFVRKEKYSDIV